MRIVGRRRDGALYLALGGGLAVILKGDRVTPTLDETVIDQMGPWTPADNSFDARRTVERRLSAARVGTIDQFVHLGMSFDEQRDRVLAALRVRLGFPSSSYMPGADLWIPQNGLGDDWVVYCIQGKYYGLPYAMTEAGDITFEGDAVEVHQTWESLDDGEPFAVDLRRSEWFKRFLASKKKQMAGLPTMPTTPELPGSLPDLQPGTNLPRSLPNA